MLTQNYTTSLTVSLAAKEVFQRINNVTKWWTEYLEGSSHQLNDAFTVRFFDDVHVSTQEIIEIIPNRRVVWLVTESKLNFIQQQDEWTNTTIRFEVSQIGQNTHIHFTHVGLNPDVECYDACTKGWNYYIKESLYKLLTEGKGTPELVIVK